MSQHEEAPVWWLQSNNEQIACNLQSYVGHLEEKTGRLLFATACLHSPHTAKLLNIHLTVSNLLQRVVRILILLFVSTRWKSCPGLPLLNCKSLWHYCWWIIIMCNTESQTNTMFQGATIFREMAFLPSAQTFSAGTRCGDLTTSFPSIKRDTSIIHSLSFELFYLCHVCKLWWVLGLQASSKVH